MFAVMGVTAQVGKAVANALLVSGKKVRVINKAGPSDLFTENDIRELDGPMRLEALNNAEPDKAMSPDRSVSWSETTVAILRM